MRFEPVFMRDFTEFKKQRSAVRTLQDWILFSRHWFDSGHWPSRTPGEDKKNIPVGWIPTFWAFGLTPEARYEYFWTVRKVGDPLRFPEMTREQMTNENGWFLECPFCEAMTSRLNLLHCPTCNRELLFTCVAD